MKARRKLGFAAVTVAASVAMAALPALAVTTTLPVDLTGPGVEWQDFDNWLVADDSGVYGCTSARQYDATGDYLSGYGPNDAETDTTDGFDTYALVTVGGEYFVNPDDDVDVTDDTITTDTATMGGLDVTVQHAALQSQPILRTLVELVNRGDAPVTQTVTFEQDLGSDDDTWIQQTSSGDEAWTAADRWSLTTEGEDPSFGDPVVTTAFFGPGSVASPLVSLDLCGEVWSSSAAVEKVDDSPGTSDGVSGQATESVAAQTSAGHFSVTIPAGETRYLAFFNSATTSRSLEPAEAVTALYDAGLTGDLAEGLDPAILPYVVNWAPEIPVVIQPTFTG